MFTGYWRILVLKFSEIENAVFFRANKLMERWYLLNTEKFLILKFLKMGNTVFFRAKKVMERWYLQITEKFLFWAFRWWEIWSFFQRKKWWKDDIYLVFLSFPWYSRTWEIWFFVQSMYEKEHFEPDDKIYFEDQLLLDVISPFTKLSTIKLQIIVERSSCVVLFPVCNL